MKHTRICALAISGLVAAAALGPTATQKMNAGSPLLGRSAVVEDVEFDMNRPPNLQASTPAWFFVGFVVGFMVGQAVAPNSPDPDGTMVAGTDQLLHDLG